jgi:periplasmic protein TonB
MTALLLETVWGTRRGDARYGPGRFHVQARSREFLRRGLVLSGALHLALLFAFLNLPGGGEEILARSYGRATEIFREPPSIPLVPLPPSAPGTPSTHADRSGIVVPVDPRLFSQPFDFKGIGTDSPARPQGGAGDPGTEGVLDGPSEAPDPDRVFQISEVQLPPVAIEAPKPPYPEVAREAGIDGRVETEVLVRADGTVARVRVKSGNTLLANSAQETLYRWRFKPAMANGRPVSVWVEISVNFTL